MNEKLQMEELMEDKSPINLLGPYRIITKLTFLDCTSVALSREGKGSKILACIVHLIAILAIFAIIFRVATYFGVEGKTMSVTWAESNYFGFMGIHAMVCAFCIYGWTKNAFIPKHCKTLEYVRTLRVVENSQLDSYSKLQIKSAIFTLPLFLNIMYPAIYAAVYQKIIFSGEEAAIYLVLLMPILAFFAWIIVSCTAIIYILAQVSIERELNYYNEELQKASDDKLLTDLRILTAFSNRQIELIKMVNQANNSLGSYGKWGPLFVFFAFVNIVYLTGFFSNLPIPYFAWVVCSIFITAGVNVSTCGVTAKVQEDIVHTSKILMNNDHFEKAENPKIYQTYRTMLDRSLNSDAKIYVCNAIPLVSQSFSIAMFFVPNMGIILLMIKKVCSYNGIIF